MKHDLTLFSDSVACFTVFTYRLLSKPAIWFPEEFNRLQRARKLARKLICTFLFSYTQTNAKISLAQFLDLVRPALV